MIGENLLYLPYPKGKQIPGIRCGGKNFPTWRMYEPTQAVGFSHENISLAKPDLWHEALQMPKSNYR